MADQGQDVRTRASPAEAALLEGLRHGDEAAFVALVDANSSWMLRTALLHVRSRAVAEEVVQEAWIAALRGLDRFEGRSSLRTWLFTILVNAARRQAAREGRTTAFSELPDPGPELAGPDPLLDRFFAPTHPRWPGLWSSMVRGWDHLPEDRLLSDEVRATIEARLASLPPAQRQVFILRDLEGWPAAEVCNVLGLSDSNQRVLLHRARLALRLELERYFDQGDRP